MGGPEKWQKWGRLIQVLSRFWRVCKFFIFIVPLSFYRCCFGRFSFHSTLFIHSPCQTGSQPMSGQYYKHMYRYNKDNNRIQCFTLVILIFFIAPLFALGITGFCLTFVFKASLYILYGYIYTCIILENLISPLYNFKLKKH